MAEQKQPLKPRENIDETELKRLRDVVLRWIETKNREPKKNKTSKTKDHLFKDEPIKSVVAPVPPVKPRTEVKKADFLKRPKIPTLPENPKPAVVKESTKPIKVKKVKVGSGRLKKIVIVLLSIVIITLITFGIIINTLKINNPITQIVTKFIPYPIAFVNTKPLYYNDWLNQVNSLANFYNHEKQINSDLKIPSLIDTQQHILNRMIDKEINIQLAKKYNIKITEEEIKKQTMDLIEELGSQQSLEQQLLDLYSWTITEFEKEILEPLLLKNKLSIAITLDDRLNQAARLKAEKVFEIVQEGEKSFEDIAFEYSEDVTSIQKGDLGYFGQGQMLPELEQAAFALEPGEVSEIIKTQFGYHIIKVEEKLLDDLDQVSQVRARHILIRGINFDNYFQEIKNKTKIIKLVNI